MLSWVEHEKSFITSDKPRMQFFLLIYMLIVDIFYIYEQEKFPA